MCRRHVQDMCRCHRGQRHQVPLGTGVTGGFELLNVGTRNQAWALGQSNATFKGESISLASGIVFFKYTKSRDNGARFHHKKCIFFWGWCWESHSGYCAQQANALLLNQNPQSTTVIQLNASVTRDYLVQSKAPQEHWESTKGGFPTTEDIHEVGRTGHHLFFGN